MYKDFENIHINKNKSPSVPVPLTCRFNLNLKIRKVVHDTGVPNIQYKVQWSCELDSI